MRGTRVTCGDERGVKCDVLLFYIDVRGTAESIKILRQLPPESLYFFPQAVTNE